MIEEMKGEKFKPRAYEKAALYIESLNEDLERQITILRRTKNTNSR
jgi:DNA polymerase/3'-5' exonuclease PolX